jgi:hypothetical protein
MRKIVVLDRRSSSIYIDDGGCGLWAWPLSDIIFICVESGEKLIIKALGKIKNALCMGSAPQQCTCTPVNT